MALNKAKVLKSAEKYVIQGKISHAIAEYQKLIKEDPTDLPLVNTLGDLYVRIGNVSEAVKCFTRLAESYDNGGFVVRAIAMYKKVSKIDQGQIQSLSRLADLYLRQGLNSDARAHYLQVADYLIKKGELDNAITVYQRVVQIEVDRRAIPAPEAKDLREPQVQLVCPAHVFRGSGDVGRRGGGEALRLRNRDQVDQANPRCGERG